MKSFTWEDRKQLRINYSYWEPKTCPYSYFDFFDYLSPIETQMWNELRSQWLPFYMQYPILNYFVDFADPVKKICIEVDWEEWHTDKENDNKRDDEIISEWWSVLRIPWKFTKYEIFDWECKWNWETEWERQNREIYWLDKYRYLMMDLISLYRIVSEKDLPYFDMHDEDTFLWFNFRGCCFNKKFPYDQANTSN